LHKHGFCPGRAFAKVAGFALAGAFVLARPPTGPGKQKPLQNPRFDHPILHPPRRLARRPPLPLPHRRRASRPHPPNRPDILNDLHAAARLAEPHEDRLDPNQEPETRVSQELALFPDRNPDEIIAEIAYLFDLSMAKRISPTLGAAEPSPAYPRLRKNPHRPHRNRQRINPPPKLRPLRRRKASPPPGTRRGLLFLKKRSKKSLCAGPHQQSVRFVTRRESAPLRKALGQTYNVAS
jgi:hypothetical protein